MELTVRWYITKRQRLILKTFGLGKWRRCRKRRIWSLDLWTTTYWRFLKTLPFFSSEIITCFCLFVCYFSWTLLCVCKQQTPAATWWCVVVRRCIHACAMATMATRQNIWEVAWIHSEHYKNSLCFSAIFSVIRRAKKFSAKLYRKLFWGLVTVTFTESCARFFEENKQKMLKKIEIAKSESPKKIVNLKYRKLRFIFSTLRIICSTCNNRERCQK